MQAKPNKTNLEYIHAFHAQPALPCLAICSTTETVVIGFVTSPGTHGITTSAAWCESLLEKEHVALVAGSAFGAEGHVRMSFAAAEEKLTAGLDRIARFLGA